MLSTRLRMTAIDALAQRSRCDIVRLLVSAGTTGLPAGVIASDLDVLLSSLSVDLTALLNAGLIECELRGSRILYRADFDRLCEIAPALLDDEIPWFAPSLTERADPLAADGAQPHRLCASQ